MRQNPFLPLLLAITILIAPTDVLAAKSRILVNAVVDSFGTYSTEGNIRSVIQEEGDVEIGAVTVNGIYNGPYPWYMRIYTDNRNYQGIAGAFRKKDPGGLISSNGQFSIPLLVNCPNYGEAYFRVPDINAEDYRTYIPPSSTDKIDYNERIIMGIDPRNAIWVSGGDKILYTDDDESKGNITMPTPFELKFKTSTDAATVKGEYEAKLYLEIVPAP